MNFDNLSGTNGSTPIEPLLNLSKGGDFLDLSKHAPSLKKAILAGGWDASEYGDSADLDIAAFMLYSDNKLRTAHDVVYFQNGFQEAQGIKHNGDNRTGAGDGDDETIDINLDNINPDIQHIVFAISIDKALEKHQTFGMIKNAFVRLVDAETNKEVVRFNLTEEYGTDTAIRACSLDRTPTGWQFTAIGKGQIGRAHV